MGKLITSITVVTLLVGMIIVTSATAAPKIGISNNVAVAVNKKLQKQEALFKKKVCHVAETAIFWEQPYLGDFSDSLGTPPPTPEQMTDAGNDLFQIVTIQKDATRRMRAIQAPPGQGKIWQRYFPTEFSILKVETLASRLLLRHDYDQANVVARRTKPKVQRRQKILHLLGFNQQTCNGIDR